MRRTTQDANSSEAEMGRALGAVKELEEVQQGKSAQVTEFCEEHDAQNSAVEEASKSMEEADRKVVAMRKLILELEDDLKNKHTEAQNMRTLASSDRSAMQARVNSEIEQVERKVNKGRVGVNTMDRSIGQNVPPPKMKWSGDSLQGEGRMGYGP